jgi:hypothetical protein
VQQFFVVEPAESVTLTQILDVPVGLAVPLTTQVGLVELTVIVEFAGPLTNVQV